MAHPILGVHRKYFLVLIPYNLRVWSERLPWRTCNNQGYHMTRVTACCWPKCHWRVRLESKLFMLVCRGELTAGTVQQFQYNNHHVAHCTYLGKSVTSTTSKSVIKRSLFGLGSRLPTYCDHSCGNTNYTRIILLLAVFLAVVTALTYWMGSVYSMHVITATTPLTTNYLLIQHLPIFINLQMAYFLVCCRDLLQLYFFGLRRRLDRLYVWYLYNEALKRLLKLQTFIPLFLPPPNEHHSPLQPVRPLLLSTSVNRKLPLRLTWGLLQLDCTW